MIKPLLLTLFIAIVFTNFSQADSSVNAGPDQTVKAGQKVKLKGTAHHASSIVWSTDGSGYFDDKHSLKTIYHPSAADIAEGKIRINLHSITNPQIKDALIVTITTCATVNIVQTSDTICGSDFGGTYNIRATVTGNHYNVQWTTDGQGYFDDETNPVTTYEYNSGDAGSGRVWLKITVYDSSGVCSSVSDSFLLRLNDPARIDLSDFGYDACGDEPVQIDGGLSGVATTVYWQTDGTGTFSANPAPSTYYNPSLQDRINGYVTISGYTNDPDGPCGPSSDYTFINFTGPTVNAGADIITCGYRSGGSFPLNSILGNNTYSITWSTNGAGYFDDEYNPNTVYNYDPSDVDNANIQIYATASNGNCADVIDTINVNLQEAPYLVFPEPDAYACISDPQVAASVYRYGYASGGTWSSSGSGTFDDPSSDYTTYHASKEDIDNGCVSLIFTTNDPAGPCGSTSGSMNACFYDCYKSSKKTTEKDISLYPNPANEIIHLNTFAIIDKHQTFITDVAGKIIACKWADKNSLNISDLANGIYFIHILSSDRTQVIKFVKQ